jgi:dihydropteroate synthase
MARALDQGADAINDIQAMRDQGALELLAEHPTAGVCLMHMRGDPGSMQQQTAYAELAEEVVGFLDERAQALRERGVAADRIVLDPGYGFAKTAAQNIALQQALVGRDLGYPLLAGWSRKSTLGFITGAAVGDRLAASLAAALAAVQGGARLLRVHDVAATVQALRTWQAMVDNPPV